MPAARAVIDQSTPKAGPGIQYAVVDTDGVVFEHTGGLADIAGGVGLTGDHLMPAFSMSTVLTAIAVLQLLERGKLSLDDKVTRFVEHPYDQSITIRQLLCHTSGIPNPLPLRWVHLPRDHARFDEREALDQVLREHRRRSFRPGERYHPSTIGYWLLGGVVVGASETGFVPYMRAEVFEPLKLGRDQLCYRLSADALLAKGYLARCSGMNLVKRLVSSGSMYAGREGRWVSVTPVYANGPSFGGAFGSARSFAVVLRDLLSQDGVLLGPKGRELLFEVQRNGLGQHVPMTLGLRVAMLGRIPYYSVAGGGVGFHSELRLYPREGLASVIMANRSPFAAKKVHGPADRILLGEAR